MKPEIGIRNGRRWVIVTYNASRPEYTYQRAWEAHEDGRYTVWGYSLYGAMGTTGQLNPNADLKLEPARMIKKHLALVKDVEESIEAGIKRSEGMYGLMKTVGANNQDKGE